MKDRFGGQHHRHQSTSDARHLVLTWPSCSWHWLVTGSTGHTSALRGHQTLTGITYTITPVAALTARPPPVGICGAPEDWNICSKYWLQCCRTCNFHSEEIPQLRGITETHVSPTLSPDDTTIQWVLKQTQTPDPLICFKMPAPTYKSERSGGINLSKTLQQIIIEGCYREVLQKPHNPVSANPSAFKDLAMQTYAAQVWRTGTHTIYHTLIRPLLWIKHSNNSAVSAIQFVYCVRKYVCSFFVCMRKSVKFKYQYAMRPLRLKLSNST